MSKGTVNQVIQRAISDAAFRRQLQSDPKKALAGFDLTTDERSAITGGDPGKLTALGVDQRMSKAFSLGGISAASASTVSPDLTGAGAAAFIDEGTIARGTSAVDPGGSGARTMAADGTSVDAGPTAAARQPVDVSGDANAFDPGIVSSATQATAGGTASNTAAARQPVDVSGDANRLDPGIESNAREATAFEPGESDLDLSMIDPGQVSGDSGAVAGTEHAAQSGHAPDSTTDAQGNSIPE